MIASGNVISVVGGGSGFEGCSQPEWLGGEGFYENFSKELGLSLIRGSILFELQWIRKVLFSNES